MNNSKHVVIMTSSTDHHGNPPFVYAAEAFIQPIILIFGFMTNIASLIVLRKVRMNEVFRICLVSLSALDTLACLVGFVQLVVEVTFYDGDIPQGHMDPPALASNTLYYIYLMFMCSSASMVITIAIIRNLFVLRPMKARGWFSAGRTKIICVINFVITLVLFAPVSLKVISQSCEKEVNVSVCDWMNSTNPSLHRVGSIYLHYFLSALYGPVTIIVYVICFICIRFTVGKSVKQLSIIASRGTSTSGETGVKEAPSGEIQARSRTARRITKTLLIILILDVICTLPYVIQGVGLLVAKGHGIFDESSTAGKVYDVIVEIFLNLRPSYNFWLYVYQHPEFRVRIRSITYRMCRPCYRSRTYCPCCRMDAVPQTPIRSAVNWSLSSPTHTDRGWFKRLSSRIQNGKNSVFVPTPLVVKEKIKSDDDARSQSMDSESEALCTGSHV
ncbi:hypothetical protein LSH36_302g05019 [Paralvinella palmiformis]|uniref:G-protein coupled receptors family 1 profile domain-containing protein n=1 Tax=Paralvinella palmiformis TaxID=53620 RepID=A0AAD9N2Q0_9ANNE|nr:hypothetical protein LSH36_302g05019 [Paralvinella palmiformis]